MVIFELCLTYTEDHMNSLNMAYSESEYGMCDKTIIVPVTEGVTSSTSTSSISSSSSSVSTPLYLPSCIWRVQAQWLCPRPTKQKIIKRVSEISSKELPSGRVLKHLPIQYLRFQVSLEVPQDWCKQEILTQIYYRLWADDNMTVQKCIEKAARCTMGRSGILLVSAGMETHGI